MRPSAQENRDWVRDRVRRAGLTADVELAALALLDGLERMWKEVEKLCQK